MSTAVEVAPLRRNRDYVLLWIGQAASLVGSHTSWIAYPLLVLSLTGSAARAGIVSFANWLPYVLLQLPAGAYVDRWHRRRTMLACDALRLVALGSVAVALPLGILRFWQLVVVAFVDNAASTFFGPAETSALSRIVPPQSVAEAVARNDAREHIATLVGPPLGGTLFGIARALPFTVDAASYAVSLASIAALRTPLDADRTTPRAHLAVEVREGLAFLWRIPFLRATALQSTCTNVAWTALILAMIVVARAHHATGAEIGAMLGLMGAGGILGSAASGVVLRRMSLPAIAIGSVWCWTALVAAMTASGNAFVLGAIGGAIFLASPTWNGAVVGARIELTPDRLQGRVAAAEALVSYGARPFGILGTGFLLDAVGGRTTIVVLAAWLLAVAVGSTLAPSLRRPPRALDSAP